MVDFTRNTSKFGNIRAICEVCGTWMNKRVSLTNLVALRRILDVSFQQGAQDLVEMPKAILNANSAKDP
jgi:hypothetical protein